MPEAPLRIWVDAQLPPMLARWLAAQAGVVAEHLADRGWLELTDRALFEAARQASAVIITKDHDFIELLERSGPPPQVVWVTLGNVRNPVLKSTFERLWPRTAALLRGGEPLVEITDAAT